MRLYTFLVIALFALATRAATIPEKKTDSIPENVSNEQPVEVVQTAEQALKNSDEVVRAPVDLTNPGAPQRQEHETQNPEFYSAEQNVVQAYKQGINTAQVFLKQGLSDVSEDIQNIVENNEQVKSVHEHLQKLRDGFIDQINTLHGKIQSYLNTDGSKDEEQVKANFEIIENGLNTIKNDFNLRVNTLTDGVNAVRADGDKPGGTPSAPTLPFPIPGQGGFLQSLLSSFQNNVQSGFANLTNSFNSFISQGQQSAAVSGTPSRPTGVQSDTPANEVTSAQPPTATGGFGSGSGPIVQAFQQFQTAFNNFFQPPGPPQQNIHYTEPSTPVPEQAAAQPEAQSVPAAQPVPNSHPETSNAVPQPAPQATQPVAVTTIGPIRQILQNNPISQSIAATVQRLQNLNNPEKPREPLKQKLVPGVLPSEDYKKGHSHGSGSGDNNDSVDSGVVSVKTDKEVLKETLIEEAAVPQKTEDNSDKTE